MIVIRDEQKGELALTVEQRWKEEFAERLKSDFRDSAGEMDTQQLRDVINQLWENAKELEITEKEDVYRFLKLNFLPKEMVESAFIQSVLIRLLNNFNLSGTKRLDFIEQQVIDRKLASTSGH